MKVLWSGVPLVLALTMPATSFADTDPLLLDTLVVTGTRNERRLLDVPVRTEVISRLEIEKTHARDLAEALRSQPGILLKDIHGKSGKELWLQGLDSDRVLVLIDGRPVSASTGSTVDLSQIASADIERIEVVKGAVSALYGSAAMGGVVNVITREPDTPLSYQIQLDSGSYGSKELDSHPGIGQHHLSVGANVAQSVYKASFMFDMRDSAGFDLDSGSYTFEGDRGSKINLAADIELAFSESTAIAYSTSWYEEDLDRDFSTFAPGQGDIKKLDIEYATRSNHTLSWHHALSGGKAIKGYLMNEAFEDETKQDVLITEAVDQTRLANVDTLKAELQLDLPLGEHQLWVVGLAAMDSQLKQHQLRAEGSLFLNIEEITPGAEHQNLEMFIQDSVFIGERWELIPGLRMQDDSDFGTHIAPKINLMFVPDVDSSLNPRVRFGLGAGYRVPNLKERHFLFDHSANGYIVLGNSQLLPESSESIQLGFETSFSNTSRGEIAVFYNHFEDLITTSLDKASSAEQQLQVFRYSNVESSRTRGVDINLSHRINRYLKLDAAYTWLDAVDLDSGLKLTRRPEHQANLSLEYSLPRNRTSLIMRLARQSHEFIDADNLSRSPGFTSLDLKINQPFGKGFKWFAGIDNVLDEHLDPDQAGRDFRPKEGRFIYTGLRYSL